MTEPAPPAGDPGGDRARAGATVIVPTTAAARLGRLLDSLAAQTATHQTIVVDNGSPGREVRELGARHPGVEVLRLERNAGYSRACNLAARRADGAAIVLLNDDCVCEPGFVERLVAALDPAAGVTMAAGVMRDWSDPGLIDSAGMELDRTLWVFDYLNGEPLEVLERGVPDPVGPSGAAAAFDREAYLKEGGFDERLFAYWEDVDLVLRLRRRGQRCALAATALGTHEHSATLGSGSARKNYLMGFGRGYVLRKWGVLAPGRIAAVLAREAALCAGQAVVDRNLAGIRGRVRGYRAASERHPYPDDLPAGGGRVGLVANLRRRAARRARLRRAAGEADGGGEGGEARDAAGSRRAGPGETGVVDPGGSGPGEGGTVAIFHLAEISGPSRSLEAELRWLAARMPLAIAVPAAEPDAGGPGPVAARLADLAAIESLPYEALTLPRGPGGAAATIRRLAADRRRFRRLIRRHRPRLVIVVSAMLPAALLAARAEGVPALVYCGELLGRRASRVSGAGSAAGAGLPSDAGSAGGARALAGTTLLRFTGRLAAGVIACSETVREQFGGLDPDRAWTIYPPVGRELAGGDRAGFRARHGIPADAPLVASLGSITEGRGQDLAIRAVAGLRARVPGLRYLVAGAPHPRPRDREYAQRLRGLAAELGVADAVTFAGHVERPADLYAAADVVVNPARVAEAFGRVPFEAAVAGRPAVITAVGAAAELLRDGESALIVPPDDPEALAAAVGRVLADRELAARLAAGARAVAEQRLRPEQSLASFERAVAAVSGGA